MNPHSSPSSADYWKQKISAYLHDPPDKVLDILGHGNRAESLAKVFGFEKNEEFRKDADFAASSADRLPWPDYKKTKCKSDYHATENPFRHPLSGERIDLDPSLDDVEKTQHETMPLLHEDDFDGEHYRRAFLALWRFWQNWAGDKNPELAFYPAETRLPDHTVWSHLAVTSAMQGCYGGAKTDWDAATRTAKPLPDNPALLLFSIGPVQDFIAASRTTRDLWSGSYLLSYLASKALGKIALDFGPDHVIFPNLKGQPLVDLALREQWQASGASQQGNFWEAFDYSSEDGKKAALTPSLPNRFLALLPEKMKRHEEWESAAEYARVLVKSIKGTLSKIAGMVSAKLQNLDDKVFIADRFEQQIDNLLDIHWQLLPFPVSFKEIQDKARELLPKGDGFAPLASLDAVSTMVENMPGEHRDKRYFHGTEDGQGLNQVAAAWPALYALAGWQLDGVKSLRLFKAVNEGTWHKGRTHNKDSLTGRDEACLVAPEEKEQCEEIRQLFPNAPKESIKPNEFLSAATLIKRFWHLTYLDEEHGFDARDFKMPNTHSIADHRPYANNSEGENGDEEAAKYYAVLALDGDQMGQWISGGKCPNLKNLLSQEARDYFEKNNNTAFLAAKRPLSPSFHLQFSEMLGNFSLHCARRIVEAFDGRLIYAGGDDVLAMLPADTAIDCAAALRAAFRGDSSLPELAKGTIPNTTDPKRRSDRQTKLFQPAPSGCIRLTEATARKKRDDHDPLVSDPHRFPVLVPGPTSDVSCGIAIGHIKSPLQDLVRAAQTAEKRAKNTLNRAACSVSLFKRSGEIHHWGFKWSDPDSSTAPVLPFFTTLLQALREENLSNRFPYRLIQVLEPYLSHQPDKDADDVEETVAGFAQKAGEIVRLELQTCLQQHLTGSGKVSSVNVVQSFDVYWNSLDTTKDNNGRGLADRPQAKIRDFIGLLSTLAWINKHKVSTVGKQPKGPRP